MRPLLAGVLVSLLLVRAAAAQGLPAEQKALLLLRVLAYDRNLKLRAKDEVRIAVVFRPGHGASQSERDALLLALEQTARRAVVSGLPVRAVAVPFRDAVSLAARLDELRPAALYTCTGLDDVAREVARAARDQGVLTVCGSREPVLQGLAVGLVDRGERAALVVNTRAAAAQGAALDSAMLGLAERVESSPGLQ